MAPKAAPGSAYDAPKALAAKPTNGGVLQAIDDAMGGWTVHIQFLDPEALATGPPVAGRTATRHLHASRA